MHKKARAKDKLAVLHTGNLAAFFKMQKTMVMRAIMSRSLSAAGGSRELETGPRLTPAQWESIWKGIAKQTSPALKEVIVSAEADGLHAGANNIRDALEGKIRAKWDKKTAFNLANPRAVAWFHERGGSVDYIKGIQDTTKEQIKTVITAGIEKGKSYTQIAKDISDTFDGFSRDRAKRIAVYETAQAYEQGNMQFAQSLKDDGIEMEKFYQTSEDDLVSDLCRGNQDDDWIPIDQYHSSGVQEPPGHVNCRCYELYRQKQESA